MISKSRSAIWIVCIAAVIAVGTFVGVRMRSNTDTWEHRAGETVMRATFVRHPLAKGLCVMVTRKGGIAQVDCPTVEHLLINPTPPELPELENE